MADSPQVHKKTRRWNFGHFVHPRPALLHQYLGVHAETAAHAVCGARKHHVVLRLPAPEPARTGRFGGRVERHVAQGRALRNVRGSHAGEVQLLVRQSASPEGRHVLGAIRPKVPRKRAWGRSSARWWGSCWGADRCATVSATTSSAALPRSGWWTPGGPTQTGRQISEGSETSGRSFWRRRKRIMTTIYIDSRKARRGGRLEL